MLIGVFLFTLSVCFGQSDGFNLKLKNASSTDYDYTGSEYSVTGKMQTCKFPVGCPDLKAYSIIVLIPNGNTFSINVTSDNAQFYSQNPVVPVTPKLEENFNGTYPPISSYINTTIYGQNKFFPENLYSFKELGTYRGQKLGVLYVYPYKYNPKYVMPDGTIKPRTNFYNNLVLNVTYNGTTTPIPLNLAAEYDPNGTRPTPPSSITSAPNYLDVIALENSVSKSQKTVTSFSTGCDFLIITHSSLLSAANRLKEYKNSRGISTIVVSLTNPVTEIAIENIIKDYYTNTLPVQKYILLLGDVELLPSSTKGSLGYLTDEPYFDMNNDITLMPDFETGRMPVSTVLEANNWIDKIIKYEKIASKDPFFNTAGVVSFFEPVSQTSGRELKRYIRTSEEITGFFEGMEINSDRFYYTNATLISNYTDDSFFMLPGDETGDIIPVAINDPSAELWKNGPIQVKQAFTNPHFLVIHRGHGNKTSWGANNYVQLNSSDVTNLNNANYTPVVWSINCLTGEFSGSDCISETLLKKQNGGAVAVIASTDETDTRSNDYLSRGLMQAVWPGFIEYISNLPISNTGISKIRMGDILRDGKNYLLAYDLEGTNPSAGAQHLCYTYHLFGDPTMELLPYHSCLPLREFTNLSFSTIVPQLFDGAEKITVSGTSVINSGNNADFRASQSINFKTGFIVKPGGLFHAVLEPCYVEQPLPDGIIVQKLAQKNGNTKVEIESNISSNIAVYPNPTSGLVTIEFSGKLQNSTLDIYNQLGRRVFSSKVEEGSQSIDLLPFGKGLYILSICEESQIQQIKVVVY